ncbi:DUF3775 domain-containing protein [Sabulicella glaciei]|uniref:DUF3775 domain-containing protein n=1 Tax=Sabulicella glaciei TaxID=2984948 RepID=A0ABT3NV15_9PROT|nr:DUF3775 domain-containing protein [Roseococcus sp. MDT2-1-1]MCW8085995.1 DUF3775 domain-containing protein [Roseococcus sp. MDT2-1-1]
MPATDEDGEVDLGVSLEVVVTVVDLANAVQSPEEGTMGDGDEDEELDDESEADDLDDEDVTLDVLTEFIDELNEDQQAALIALAWIGRGDYDAESWDEALKLAYERNAAGTAAQYLVDMQGLGDLLAEGVAAFGLSVEDVER